MIDTMIARLQNVSVSYSLKGGVFRRRRLPVLTGIDLVLERGDRLGVIGRNGAGKSTLLRLIADLIHPDSGRVDRNYNSCQLLSLSLGFTAHLSGRENAVMGGLLQGLSRRQIHDLLPRIQEFSGLGDFFDEELRTYSSGMQARLGFSLAIELKPELLLIDEVLAVGDHDFREISKRALHDRINSGITVVLVSHMEEAIQSLCNKVVWIEHGKIMGHGPPGLILEQYNRSHAD